ncbi:MAG: glycosyltransferase family 4 protein [Candidatus Poseidoniaceae archaeon]|nr:glycosyltransferase family 4 protein [Candidatus Poseidoniaceae archaeon]
MPKVLHIGPCETPGGMANVMRILAEHPPEGWEAELLSSHVVGSHWGKWRAYRQARAALAAMLKDETRRPDIVHLHTAADWSWWRKRRFAQMAHKAGVPNIVHIHSGQFDRWLSSSSNHANNFRKDVSAFSSHVVVLSASWQRIFGEFIGDTTVVHNPLDPGLSIDMNMVRDPDKILFLGRNDPIKGGVFAQELVKRLRQSNPDLFLAMSGIESSKYPWVHCLGWVTEEEKREHLSTASLLLVPSKFEGQPIVVLEALVLQTPVLLSDTIHSLSELLPRARYEDVGDWKNKVESILSSKPKQNQEILLDYSLSSIRKKWEGFYQELLIEA